MPIAAASSHGSQPPRPPTASHPPTGATAIASPRNSCVHVVKRLASEYQNTMASATGDSAKQSGFSCHDAATNAAADTATRSAASRVLMTPRGISSIRRPRVEGVHPGVDENAIVEAQQGEDFIGMGAIFDQPFGPHIHHRARHQRVHQVEVVDHQIQHHRDIVAAAGPGTLGASR